MNTITLFDDAASLIHEKLTHKTVEQVEIRESINRVLAEDVYAKVSVPPFHRSMMDGFAVCEQDLKLHERLYVKNFVPAGSVSLERLVPGQAARVMTGAPVPLGTGAVCRFEWCETDNDGYMTIKKVPQKGDSIQRCGSDGEAGKLLVRKGHVLTELDAAVLQTFGVSHVSVIKVPTACVFVTGSELVMDNRTTLGPAQIYGTNDLLLQGALTADGICVTETAALPDDLDAISSSIERASKTSDYVILTGGVSVGDRDFTTTAIENAAGDLLLRKVLMRPGSPFVFAQKGSCSIFGLSGNPAACFVQYATLIRPAIEAAFGGDFTPFPHSGVLTHAVSLKSIKHVQIHRARVSTQNGRLLIDSGMAQSTGVISTFVEANAYVRFDDSEYEAGDVVPFRLIRPL